MFDLSSRLAQQYEQVLNLQSTDPSDSHFFFGGVNEYDVSPKIFQ